MSLAVPLALRRELDALDLDVRLRPPGTPCDDLVVRARSLRAEARRAGIAVVAGVAALREGELLLEAGQAPEAIAALDAAARELAATGSTDLATAALARLSDGLVAAGDLRRALAVCAEGIDLVERDRYKTSAPYLQAGYLRRTIALYANGVRAGVELGDGRALGWVELSKSRVLPGASNRGGGAGAAEAGALEARLAELGQRIDRGAERGRDTAALRRQRRAVFDELVATERRGTPLPDFDLAQVRGRLDSDQCAISYYWLDPARLLITVVGRTVTHLHVQPVAADDRAELDTLVAAVLGTPGAVAYRVHSATIDRCLARLAAVLVPPPVRVAIAGAARLLVAPHRSLHVVPFGAVPVDGQPLVRRAAVAVVPNLTALQLPPPATRTPRLLAVGAAEYRTGGPDGGPPTPLPHAEREVEEIARAYADRRISVDVLAGAAVTEAALERHCADGRGPTCLHLALHGASVESDTPLESWLLLPRSRLDGIDLVRWRLPGATVVLSACCSGQRAIGARGMQELPGDDLFGLQTAFFSAGARQVLGALWPVHDRVARSLTTAFHVELLSGVPADVALQRAVIAHLDTAGVLHRQTGYWAPFFLSCIGTPTALETPP